MANQKLVEYIREQLKAGYDINRIKSYLIANGYNQTDIDPCINEIYHPEVKHVVHHVSKRTLAVFTVLVIIIFSTFSYFYFFKSSPQAQLLDLRTSLISSNIKEGDKLEFNVELFNLGKAERYDVFLKHEIIGTEIYEEETIAVETSTSKKSEIQLPKEMTAKRYTLKTTASYADKKAFSTFGFNVVAEEVPVCIEDWNCDIFLPEVCTENKLQTRTCTDLNNCRSSNYKPETEKSCIYEKPEETDVIEQDVGLVDLNIWEKLDFIKEEAKTDPIKAVKDCSLLEIDSHKDECFFNVAEITELVSRCDKIISSRTKDKCINNVAKLSDNSELCEQMEKQTRKDSCYMNFVKNKDYSVCEKIENSYLRDACMAFRNTPPEILAEIQNRTNT